MNYADIKGGTWYPRGGMYSVVKAMHELAIELGVKFCFNEEAEQIFVQNDRAKNLVTNKKVHEADVIISAADYHFTEEKLLQDGLKMAVCIKVFANPYAFPRYELYSLAKSETENVFL